MDALSSGLPRYRDLPIDPSKPPGSAWGVFGDDDEVGTINLLTPERVRRAAGLVRKGAVFSLNWELDKPSPPLFRHYRAVCLLGIAFGELFVLDALAADCAADGVFDGLFSAAPLNKIGGSGSSANALALK